MAQLLPTGRQYYTDTATGLPLNGGKVYTYAAGTSTPKATYTSAAATTANTNPVILDARGEAVIFWDGAYKIAITDSADNVIYTIDNVSTGVDASSVTYDGVTISSIFADHSIYVVDSIADLENVDSSLWSNAYVRGYYLPGDGGGGVYYYDSGDTTTANNGGTVIVASDNARWKLELNGEPVNAMQFGAKNDGTTDSTTFVQAAIDAARLSTSKVVRITGRIYCASDIDYSGVKLSGDCAGWVAGSGMDAVEDYPSIMLLGSNSLDATDGGGVIDGLFVVQKNIASGGTYPLPWANGTVAGNAVAAYSGTAIKSTGLPSIVRNCVIAGFALGLSGNITGENNDIDCTAGVNLSLETQDLQEDLVGFNVSNFLAPTLSTSRSGAAYTITSDWGFNLVNCRGLNYAAGSVLTSASTNVANLVNCELYNSAAASASTVTAGANSTLIVTGGTIRSGGAFAPISIGSGVRYSVRGVYLAQTSTANITLASGASYGIVSDCIYTGTLVDGDATALLKCVKNNQLVASTPTAFTPVLTIGGSTTGITYGRQYGNYVINGNVVTGTINILLTSKGAQTGALKITGLPRTASNVSWCDGSMCASEWTTTGMGVASPTGRIIYNTSEIVLRVAASSASRSMIETDITDNFLLIATFTYLIDI